MNSVNLNYLRGLYDFLFNKTDEELEKFDINSAANQRALFDEMKITFLHFGPTSKMNVVAGINVILSNYSDGNLWRSAIPHDLPLNRVANRQDYLERMLFSIANEMPTLIDLNDVALVDEIGPKGLDYSK